MTWASVVWTRSSDRQSAARLISLEVSRSYGVEADAVRITHICPRCGGAGHGRPVIVPWERSVAPPSVSVSRAAGLVAVVVSSQESMGIDVEHVESFSDSGLAAVMLHEHERAPTPAGLATTWVRKESLLKAAGYGLSVDPRGVRLTGPQEEPVVLEWPNEGGASQPTWVRDVDLGPRVRAALAGLGPIPDEISVRQAGPGAARGSARSRRAG